MLPVNIVPARPLRLATLCLRSCFACTTAGSVRSGGGGGGGGRGAGVNPPPPKPGIIDIFLFSYKIDMVLLQNLLCPKGL